MASSKCHGAVATSGPRGATSYINDKGKKVYTKDASTSRRPGASVGEYRRKDGMMNDGDGDEMEHGASYVNSQGKNVSISGRRAGGKSKKGSSTGQTNYMPQAPASEPTPSMEGMFAVRCGH